jgi:hypothetical protein
MCEFGAGPEHFVVEIKYMGFIFEETPTPTPIGSAFANRTSESSDLINLPAN